MYDELARLTTPAFIYRPCATEVQDIREAYLIIKQYDKVIIEKSLADGYVDENCIVWELGQEDTQKLDLKNVAKVKVDYITLNDERYTTHEKVYKIIDSGKQEVI